MDIHEPKHHFHKLETAENTTMPADFPPRVGDVSAGCTGASAISGEWASNEKERCVMLSTRGLALVCVVLVLLSITLAEAKGSSGVKVIPIDCDRGDNINAALEDKADELILEISGTCQEDVVIARDDVTLRGLDPDATVVAQANQAILIDRASRVSLENLTVTGSTGPGITGEGIFIVHSSGVIVSDVTAEGNREGMRTYGSTLRIVDSDFCRNSAGGLYIANGSSLLIDGEEINASENGSYGLLVSESAVRSPWIGTRLLANDNGFAGVEIQSSAQVILKGGLEAKRNEMGIYVEGGSLWVNGSVDISENWSGVYTDGAAAVIDIGGEAVSVSGNGGGLWARDGAYIWFTGTMANNTWGCAAADGGARIVLQETVCQDNGWGVLVHGATARIQDSTIANNTNGDVDLSFGARVTFDGANTVDVVSCDDTVLVEGDVTCPETKGETASPSLMERVGLPGLLTSDLPASEWIP